jgi:hypothetical protein
VTHGRDADASGMEGHDLAKIQWIASAAGSGFVGRCVCGFETRPGAERADAIAEMSGHVVAAFSAPRRRRWGRRPGVVDLRDNIAAR